MTTCICGTGFGMNLSCPVHFNSPTPGSGQQKIKGRSTRGEPRKVNSKNHTPAYNQLPE